MNSKRDYLSPGSKVTSKQTGASSSLHFRSYRSTCCFETQSMDGLNESPLKQSSVHSAETMETEEVTQRSSSSFEGGFHASLDLDHHGSKRQEGDSRHHRQMEESCAGYEESFMMEDSFAMGESMNGDFIERGDYMQGRNPSHDLSSVIAFEDDNIDQVGGEEERFLEAIAELSRHRLEKATLKPQTSNISLEA